MSPSVLVVVGGRVELGSGLIPRLNWALSSAEFLPGQPPSRPPAWPLTHLNLKAEARRGIIPSGVLDTLWGAPVPRAGRIGFGSNVLVMY